MSSFLGRIAPAIFFVFLAIFAFAANGLAQDLDEVTISGRVVDPNNAPVVGATVAATLVTTNVERTIVTDEDGRYRIVELQPGIYKVRVTQTGFGTQEKINIETVAGQNVQLDFSLVVGDVRAEQTVTIGEDDSPVVDTTRTVVGGTITEREIEELPNSTRNPLDFVFTLGGVTEDPLSTRDLAEDASSTGVNEASTLVEGGIFSLSGGAAYSNNITIDGLDNNDDRGAADRFQPSIDSIAEVQVITNQFSAEYGRASGGRVNIRTRAGTNKFRGRAYMFFRDDNLNANTYNNNRRSIPRPAFTEYDPGFTFSGPIPVGYFKNKTYFFSAYEHVNLSDTTLIDTVVPVAQNPRFALPAPTNPGGSRPEITFNGLIAPYIVSVNTPSRNHIFTQRIDHNFTDSHNVTFNYQFGRLTNFRQYQGATRILEDALQGRTRNNDAFYFTDNYVFTQKLVNQFRYQFSNFKPGFAAENPNDPVILITVRDPVIGGDNRSGTLTAGNSTANFASTRREKRHQFQDTLNYVAGAHTIKGGVDVQLIESENLALGDATGTYNFNSVDDFLANRVVRFRQNFGTNSIQNNTYTGVFLQDEWRATSKLTISAGLRYEQETVVDDTNNFGPRVGVAYAPFGDKTVIRVGAGIFYNRALLRTLDDYALGTQQRSFDSRSLAGPGQDVDCFLAGNANQPRCVFLAQLSTTFPNVPTFEQLSQLNAFSTPTTFTRRLDPNLKLPESYQFNVGFERDIGSGIAVEANFTYNKTVRLWRETNVNAFILPEGFDTYTDFLLSINDRSTPFRFVLGQRNNTTDFTPTLDGTILVNLNSTNNSNAATSPIGRARTALAARLNRGVNNSLGQIEEVGSTGRSVYRGLILEMRRRFRQLGYGFGASFRAAYTFSRLRDDGIVNTSSAQIAGNFEEEFSRSVQDRRHRFAISGSFEMPKWLGKLRFSPVLRAASGNPFNLSIGGFDRNLDDVSNDRPNFTGDVNIIRFRNPGEPFPQSILDGLSLAPIGSPGNLPRNAGRGPAQFIFDLNVSREFRFTERIRLRPTIEFDNIFNRTIFTFSSDFINFDLGTTPAAQAQFTESFLVPQRTLRQRQIRLGLRFDF